MGAWNYGVFDDDTAYDALTDLKNSLDIIADMERYFDEVIQAEYIGYDEAHYALVSAAVIDSVINSFVYRCDEEDYFEWTSSQKCFDFSPLKQKAVTAIGAILSDNSELRELWEENEELYAVQFIHELLHGRYDLADGRHQDIAKRNSQLLQLRFQDGELTI